MDSSNIDSVLFSIYRDDGVDILVNGKTDQQAYQREMDSLHPNLKWDLTCEKEGGYLDLFLMIKDRRIEWKTFTKTHPLTLAGKAVMIQKSLKVSIRARQQTDTY